MNMSYPRHRICLWSGPRNVSTALMYAFAQREDTCVVDEPFYGHYLRVSGAEHPGADEIMASMDCDAGRIIINVILGEYNHPTVFFKSMTHHLIAMDWQFLAQLNNVLLIRDPIEMIPSLSEVLTTPTLRDTGYKKQVDLLKALQRFGQLPPILDAREVLKNPTRILQQLCDQIDIPFDAQMLYWPAGPIPEDGVWAKYWYHNLHQSTGFQPYRPKTRPFPKRLRPLLEKCQPYYEQLSRYVIRA